MAKITLSRLTLKNFRSFEDEHELVFDGTGLYLVRGFNHDSRGESGSGKSTIFLAIAYVLDYSPYSATELRTWLNDEPFYVELELATDKGPAVIHRGDKLWLKYEGKKITSAKAVSEKLDEICGMNKKLREAITYRKQRTFGLFLSKTDSQKKEFLVELLRLHWLEDAIEEAVKKVSITTKAVEAHVPMVELRKQIVDEAKARVPDEGAAIDTSSLEEEIKYDVIALKSLSDHRAVIKNELDTYKNTPFEYDTSLIDRQCNLLSSCRTRVARMGQPEMLIQRAQREIFRLHAEVHKLFDDKCPRCDRQWDKAQDEMERNHQEIQRQEVKLKEAEDANEKLKVMKEMESVMTKQLDELQEMMRAAERAHLQQITLLSMKKSDSLMHKEGELNTFAYELSMKKMKLDSIRQQAETSAKMRKQALDGVAAAESNLIQIALRHNELVAAQKLEMDYLGMMRGFLGQIFGEILQEISQETNRIIANLPNAAKVTLQFETDRETQDGKIRNEITPVAYFGGRSWPLESGASGGMFTSIELAVDLAVGNVIARRTGVELGWMILDEAFANGSDKVTKEGCLEILKQYSADKLIIVVEHASEFKEMFSRVIEVDYQNERSRIR